MSDSSSSNAPVARSGSAVDRFLDEVRGSEPAGRLIFALDATMSRQPTWDAAAHVQAQMFEATAAIGGLAVQLVYFRGFGECRASRWVRDARALKELMVRIDCRGGRTQIGRVLAHARTEAQSGPLGALVYVGDALEEPVDLLCELAGELGIQGVKAFMFHEGSNAAAEGGFREIARLTGGAYAAFDAGAARHLSALLRAAAVYAGGGAGALARLAAEDATARKLIGAMQPR
jgi:hypothetical protein